MISKARSTPHLCSGRHVSGKASFSAEVAYSTTQRSSSNYSNETKIGGSVSCDPLKLEKRVMVGSVAVHSPEPHFLCRLQFWSLKLAIRGLVVLRKKVQATAK